MALHLADLVMLDTPISPFLAEPLQRLEAKVVAHLPAQLVKALRRCEQSLSDTENMEGIHLI